MTHLFQANNRLCRLPAPPLISKRPQPALGLDLKGVLHKKHLQQLPSGSTRVHAAQGSCSHGSEEQPRGLEMGELPGTFPMQRWKPQKDSDPKSSPKRAESP